METSIAGTSPQVHARIAGILYLIIIVIGALGEALVRGKLIVAGDATATAERILASESLWRIGIAGELVLLLCAIPLALILYLLLRPVNKELALLALFFNLITIAIEGAGAVHLVSALFPLSNADFLTALDPHHLHALAYLSTRSHAYGFGIALVFFGVECLILGHLISRAGYLPRAIGILMQLAGLSYLTNCFSVIVSPALANHLFPWILLPALVGELSLCLWLLVKGLNLPKWEERIGAMHASRAWL